MLSCMLSQNSSLAQNSDEIKEFLAKYELEQLSEIWWSTHLYKM